jgi:hypothetical protein
MTSKALSPAVLRPFVATVSAALWLVAAILIPGCGPGKAEFSSETKQTADSLAQEFIFRYRTLPAQASGKSKARAIALEKARTKQALNETDEKGKSSRNEAATKKAPPATLDALIDAIEAKLGDVPGKSKGEVARKILSRLKEEASIDEADRAVISERLGKAAGGA